MTRILVFSDLHHEQRPAWSIPGDMPEFDVAVVAGDVDTTPVTAVQRLAAAPGLKGRPVVYVPGNHEFYHGDLERLLGAGQAACEGTNVHLLDRRAVELAGVRFVGAILWTDFELLGNAPVSMTACRGGIDDFRMIRTTAAGGEGRFLPEHAAARHALDRAFIAEVLSRPHEGASVVVTHHAPHRGSIQERYAGDQLCAGYVSHLDDVIAEGKPDLWIHGHVHASFDYHVEGTRVVCNPKGYGPTRIHPHVDNADFDPRMVIEV